MSAYAGYWLLPIPHGAYWTTYVGNLNPWLAGGDAE